MLHHASLVEKIAKLLVNLEFCEKNQKNVFFACKALRDFLSARSFSHLLHSLFLGAIVKELFSGWCEKRLCVLLKKLAVNQ